MSPEQVQANLASIAHAAYVLPKLVAAAKHLQQDWGMNLTEPMTRLNQALATIENINKSQTHRKE